MYKDETLKEIAKDREKQKQEIVISSAFRISTWFEVQV